MPSKPKRHDPHAQRNGKRRPRHEPPKPGPERWGQGRGGRPWRRKRERIFKRDGYMCQDGRACGGNTPVTLHGKYAGVLDHIKPLSRGGTDDDDNLRTICQACDKVKSRLESRGGVG